MTAGAPAYGEPSRLYAVSPAAGTLVVLATDPKAGGLRQTGCFAAAARAGCTTVPALAGASDVAAWDRYVVVAARDADAIVVFERAGGSLARVPGAAGCAAAAIAGCTAATALDEPVAVAVGRGEVFVAARGSDAVSRFALGAGTLQPDGCVQQAGGAATGCTPGRALEAPEDVRLLGGDALGYLPPEGLAVASSGSDGVAVLDHAGPLSQPPGAAGCMTEDGADGCAAGAGLRGAARLETTNTDVFAAAPGAGAVTWIARGGDGVLSHRGSVAAPTAALAMPPLSGPVPADGPSYAFSHLYAAGAGIAPFARPYPTRALTPMTGPAFAPAGPVAGLAVSTEPESLAVYAAVPSAGAVVGFHRNIPPSCGVGWFRPDPVDVPAAAARIGVGCHDPNGDALAYSVATPPRLGRIIGFDGTQALYRGPMVNRARRLDWFTIRASDGGEAALHRIDVRLTYITGTGGRVVAGPPSVRILDRRARMDRRGRIRLRVRCTTDGGSRCRTRIAVRRGRAVGRAAATLRSGVTRRVRVRLAKRTRRAVRRARRGLLLRVAATGRDAAGRSRTATRRVRVRARR
jgi:hypothetical protein